MTYTPTAHATKWQFYDYEQRVSASLTVLLPLTPKTVVYEAAADIKEVSFPTKSNSLLISLGKKVDKLTLTGVLAEGGKTGEQIYTDYITNIQSMVRFNTGVMMPSGLTRYNGRWILNNFQYQETGGYTVSFPYTIQFIRGVNGSDTAPGIVI